jgi:hypothetical protein
MNPRTRFHVLAILAICTIVIGLHSILSNPQKTITIQEIGNRYVRIYQADWGLNCNAAIATAMQSAQYQRATVRPLPGTTSTTTPLPLAYATPGNALKTITNECAKTLECAFIASTEIFGQVHQGCAPELKIGYRCDPIERLQQRTFRMDESVKITCTP